MGFPIGVGNDVVFPEGILRSFHSLRMTGKLHHVIVRLDRTIQDEMPFEYACGYLRGSPGQARR